MESVTFKVSDDIQIETYEKQEHTIGQRLKNNHIFKETRFEAFDKSKLLKFDFLPLKLGLNGFAEAVHLAYSDHYGLTLAPHHLLIVIIQGLAIHVNLNGDKYKEQLGFGPEKEGKEDIVVTRNDFRMGENNPWNEVFPEFVDIIGTKINKDVHDLLVKPFSTSDELSVTVTCLTVMDLYKSYFNYILMTGCGIPEITLLGTLADWTDLITRVKILLNKFEDLKFWSDELIPVLEEFVKAKQSPDNIVKDFWTKLYKPQGGSGRADVTGWICAFYPYTQTSDGYVKNEYIEWKKNVDTFAGLTFDQIPVGFTKTPFIWNYYGKEHKMSFIGGFLGVKESKADKHIEPALSWAVAYDE